MSNSGVHVFLCIRDIANGRAETIESSIFHYLSDSTLQVSTFCAIGSGLNGVL